MEHKITFVGLGIMGSRMAQNLLHNGVNLTVYNRSKAPVEALVAKGAKTAATLKEAVAEADIVFSILSTPEVVEQLFLGTQGAIQSMKKGAMWVDCSTVNPSFSEYAQSQAEQAGIQFVDAPVAGTKPHAANAELVFFVGGKAESYPQIMPYLNLMGKKNLFLGAPCKGTSFKMLVNIMLAQSMIIFSEAVLLGEKMGLAQDFLLKTIPNLVVAAPFTKFKAAMIKEENYEVQFPLEWMYKDLQLAAQTAYEHQQPLYLANHAKELFAAANQQGLGRKDFAAIHAFLAKA